MKKLTRHPWSNAVMASLYIASLVLLMDWASRLQTVGKQVSIVFPMIMISIFTLSAAVMGYLFLAQPLMMYLDGKKKEAVSFFLKTVGVFAGITLVAFAATLLIK